MRTIFGILSILSFTPATILSQGTRMLRHPAVSKDLVAFEYAGARDGPEVAGVLERDEVLADRRMPEHPCALGLRDPAHA